MPFFAKIPCFSLFLPVSFVSWAQVFHKPKVKGFLHRQEYLTSRGNPTGCSFSPYFRRFYCMMLPVYTCYYTKSNQNPQHCIPCPKSRCQFILIFMRIYGIIVGKERTRCAHFFYFIPPRGIFLFTKKRK